MKTAKLAEAVAGDLDGLDAQVTKTEDKKPEGEQTPAAPAAAPAATAEPAKPEGDVTKTTEAPAAAPAAAEPAKDDPLAKLAASMADLAGAVQKSVEVGTANATAIAALATRMEAIEKGEKPAAAPATEATPAAPTREVKVVYKGDADLDQSLATLSSGSSMKGKEVKKSDDVWKGSALDIFGG